MQVTLKAWNTPLLRNAPYEPSMMLKVLIYGYATGVYSSRGIARKLEEDVAFRSWRQAIFHNTGRSASFAAVT